MRLLNACLFTYLLFLSGVEILFEPPSETPMDVLMERHPWWGAAASGGIMVLALLGGTFILAAFWNRFMTDVFGLRAITRQEALSLVMIGGVFFGTW